MGRRKTPMEWAYGHTKNLKKKKDELCNMNVYSNIQQYLGECGSEDYSVGYWTILKHISLAYCLTPFGIILNSKGIRNTVYLDLFCGTGITPLKARENTNPQWIVGSPVISTRMTNYPFAKYYFGDKHQKPVELVRRILEDWDNSSNEKRDYEIFQQDANVVIKKIFPRILNKYVFAFIDPTGFQWDWNSMKLLFKIKKFDIIMNFQTRQVDRISSTRETEDRFFGPCSELVRKCSNCDEKLKTYINQIKEFGLYVTPIRIGKNRSDQYYYHLLHISPIDSYKSIPNDLKNWVERFDGESIKRIWEDLHTQTRQISLPI